MQPLTLGDALVETVPDTECEPDALGEPDRLPLDEGDGVALGEPLPLGDVDTVTLSDALPQPVDEPDSVGE